ncbi:MAG TPA: nitroreductase family protein, partial [Acidimicrobiales bacterium]|nr:nitroreductase family protein [Acidimicrobiales bacterium]
MEFDEVLRRRRMVRRFTDEPVSEADAERLVAAFLRAPSAGFTQGYHLLVLSTPDERRRFWGTTAFEPPTEAHAEQARRLEQAPLLLVPLCSEAAYRERYEQPDKAWVDSEDLWSVPYWWIDAGFGALLLLLKAVDLGLGALFMALTAREVPAFRGEFAV